MKHIILFTFVFIAFITSIFGQTTTQQANSFELDIPITWAASYEAKTKIHLKDGFSFKPNNGSTFNAKINSSITSTENAGNGNIAEGLTVGYTGAGSTTDAPPGALPLMVDVSPIGASTASMAFAFPKGMGGIAPQIGMSYSSQSSDGAFGKNWNLTGISSITRVPQTYYYDGNAASLKFDNTDRLSLDGNRMFVKTGFNNLAASSEYELEAERFSTSIKASSSTNSGAPESFTIQEKDGSIITYGGSSTAAKVIVNNKVYAWLVSKIEDARGNYITFTYTPRTDGQIELDEIKYTVNKHINNTAKYKIDFTYSTKYTETKYNSGATFAIGRCIENITLYDNESSTELVAYNFTYTGKKLTQIDKKIKGSLACKPTIINWNNISTAANKQIVDDWEELPSVQEDNTFRTFYGDFDGDGVADLLNVSRSHQSNSWKLISKIGTGSETISYGLLPGFNKFRIGDTVTYSYTHVFDIWGWEIGTKTYDFEMDTRQTHRWAITATDIDYDGILELCLIEGNKYDDPTDATFKTFKISGNQLVEQTSYRKTGLGDKLSLNFLSNDFTGDGQIDLIPITIDRTYMDAVTPETIQSVTSPNKYIFDNVRKNYVMTSLNFNGNSKMDLLMLKDNKIQVFEASEVAGLANTFKFEEISSVNITGVADIQFGDFNADGLNDFMVIGNNDLTWDLYFSNGINFVKAPSSFVTSINSTPSMPTGATNYSINPKSINFASASDYYNWIRTNGDDDMYKQALNNKYIFTDINADGRTDIVRINRFVVIEGSSGTHPVTFSEFKVIYTHDIYIATETGFTTDYISGGTFSYYSVSQDYPDCSSSNTSETGYLEYKFLKTGNTNAVFTADVNENGINDLMFFTDQTIEFDGAYQVSYGTILEYFTGLNEGFISKVTDGHGVRTQLTYDRTTNDAIYSHSSTAGLPTNVYELPIPMHVVSNKSVTAANLVSNTGYKYSTFRLHTQKGLLGFKTLETDDLTTKYKTVTNFDIQSKYLIPLIANQQQYKNGDLISETVNTYTFEDMDAVGLRYFQYLSSSSTTNINGFTTTKSMVFDKTDGDLTVSRQIIDDYNYITTLYSNHNKFGQPLNKDEFRAQNGTQETNTTYAYDGYGNLLSESCNDVTITNTYNSVNHTTLESSHESVLNQTTYYTYDNTKRFVTKKEVKDAGNNLLFNEKFSYNTDGQISRSVSKNGLVNAYQYDKFGNLIAELLPNGIRTAFTYGWATGSGIIGAKYFKASSDDVGNTSITYYDQISRELKNEFDPAGNAIAASTVTTGYYSDGTIQNKVSSVDGTTSYIYYPDGRVNEITSMDKTVSYSYTMAKTTTTIAGVEKSKTINEWGQLTKASDDGGDVVYTYHCSGNPETITTNGTTVSMTYNEKGQQLTLTDPDAGTITYTYYDDGRLHTTTDAAGNITSLDYDPVTGQIWKETYTKGSSTVAGNQTRVVEYEYYTEAPHKGMLKKVTDDESGVETSYTYDNLGRTLTVTEKIDKAYYTFTYEYDIEGKVTRIIYPDGYEITQTYNGPALTAIYDTKAKENLFADYTYNARNQVVSYKQGYGGDVTNGYDLYGKITSNSFGTGLNRRTYEYDYTQTTGLLNWRKKTNVTTQAVQQDNFSYDNLYRLRAWTVSQTAKPTETHSINYANNGNITYKSDIGAYEYSHMQPHAVSGVWDLSGDAIDTKYNSITYNAFNSIASIKISNTAGSAVTGTYSITYGPDNQRRITEYGTDKTIYMGLFEKRSDGNNLHYIQTPDGLCGLVVTKGGTQTNYYLHNDHLGSLIAAEGSNYSFYEFSYDPWGRRRKATDWNNYDVTAPTLFTRGYTGHEHIDVVNLINMNGRVYSPRLGRMLSPDNYVQMPDFSQNFNRFSYCLNNPLMYTDPDGEFIFTALWGISMLCTGGATAALLPIAIGADVGTYAGGAIQQGNANPFKWDYSDGDLYKGMAVGAMAGGLAGSFVGTALNIAGAGSFGTTGGMSFGYEILTNGLITANTNMISAAFRTSGDLDAIYKEGLIGFASGTIGAAAGSKFWKAKYSSKGGFDGGIARGVNKRGFWSSEGLTLRNQVTAVLNGFGTRMSQGYNNGLRGADLWIDGALGAFEGYLMTSEKISSYRIFGREGGYFGGFDYWGTKTNLLSISLRSSQPGYGFPGYDNIINMLPLNPNSAYRRDNGNHYKNSNDFLDILIDLGWLYY